MDKEGFKRKMRGYTGDLESSLEDLIDDVWEDAYDEGLKVGQVEGYALRDNEASE